MRSRPRDRALFTRAALLCGALAALAPAGLATGCGGARVNPRLSYGDRARAEYEAAMELLNAGDFDGAKERFTRIKREYALSSWGWLAELRLADIDVRQERYTEAISLYRAWIRYHPSQPQVDYAHFMIAKCYFSQIPTDSVVTPAPWERDLSSANDAEENLARFVRDHASSEHAAEARELLVRTRAVLARAELAVADYYLSRRRFDAAISRLRTILAEYQGSGLEPEALLRVGEVFLSMNRRDDAREAFEGVLRSYASSTFAEAARRYLRFLGPAPARATPAAGPANASPRGPDNASAERPAAS